MVYQWKVLCSRIVPWFTVTDNIYKIESANMLTFFFFSQKKKKKKKKIKCGEYYLIYIWKQF